MASTNINRVILTGNLTRDPELRSLSSGAAVCSLRVASNARRKDSSTGQWVDKANFFDVTVWGAQAESCARFLAKGRAIAVDGRLEWREFETRDGHRRQAIEIVAEHVQFLSGSDDLSDSGARHTTGDDAPAGPSQPDDDIPF